MKPSLFPFILNLYTNQSLKYRRWLFLLFQRIRRKFTRNSIRRFLLLLTRFQIEAKKTHRNPISYFISDVSTLNIANLILLIRQCIQCPFGLQQINQREITSNQNQSSSINPCQPKRTWPDRSFSSLFLRKHPTVLSTPLSISFLLRKRFLNSELADVCAPFLLTSLFFRPRINFFSSPSVLQSEHPVNETRYTIFYRRFFNTRVSKKGLTRSKGI